MTEKRVHIVVSGHVQGVFFRTNTETTAQELGLFGRVKNLSNGTVEIVAEGSETNLKKLVDWCNDGPPTARVENIHVEWKTPLGEFSSFQIAH